MTNIKIALELGAKKLKNSSSTPMLDAEILLCLILNKSRLDLINIENNALTNDQNLKFMSSIIRRSNFEPIAYITKQKEFWSKKFEVNTKTLIPRPETLSPIHISEPTRPREISYAVFCLKKFF